jgi:hypothetical protein
MRRKMLVVLLLASIFLGGVMGLTHQGPAPSSGDGDSEGPEWAGDYGPSNPDSNAPGPAPSSGDGDSDGPGW